MNEAPDGQRPFRALVVEDDKSQLRTLGDILEDEGFETIGCATANEALDHLGLGQVDVAVVDLRLPDLSEKVLLEKLGTFSEDAPIIIHTGHRSYESAKEAINWGVFAYVEKAGDPAELLRQVHRAVQTRLVQRAEALEQAVAERTRDLENASDALRENEELFRTLANSAPIGIYLTDANGNCTYVNARWSEMAGLTFDEAQGDKWVAALHPEDREAISSRWYSMIRSQGCWEGEYRFQDRQGKVSWVYGSAAPLTDKRGEIIGYVGANVEITERKRAEEALRESQKRYQTLTEVSPVAVYQTDSLGNCIYANERWLQMTGMTMEDTLGDGWKRGLHPEDQERVFLEWSRTVRENRPFEMEYRLKTSDGLSIPVLGQATAERNDDGEITGYVGTLTDITEQKQAEVALCDSETRFREVFNNMSNGVAIYDVVGDGEDFVFKDINPAGARIGDMRREEILGRSVQEVHPGVRELGLLDVLCEVAQTGRPCHHPVSAYRDERLSLWVENYVCKLPSGEIVAVYDDVTERKQAEEARQRVLTLLEKAEHVGMSGSWSQDMQTGREEWSQGEYNIHGLSLDVSPSHERHLQCVHPEDRDRHDKLFKEHLASDKTHCTQEYRIQREDGKIRHIEANYQIVRDDAGRPLSAHGTDKDITERKLLEEQLRHAKKMEAVGQLAAGVAHEFNNLLFGILGSAERILATHEGELPEYLDRPLRDIKKCGQRGAALTKQLLSFARKKAPELSLLDINQVVSELDSVLRQVIGETISLETGLAADLTPIQADQGEIEQAIMNLARNARDAMPVGGTLTIRTAVDQLDDARVSTNPHARPGPHVQLSVADTGCGMSPETKERIFEPFFTTKPVGKGTGLGLSTVFADVTENGGIIDVESRQGEGTTFRVYLPAAEETNDAANDDMKRSADQCPGGSETILVVDDDEVVLDSAGFLLETRGYSIVRANGGREALEAAASHNGPIELLLTDVTMPEMNGWELAQKLAEQRPDTKVIFMSGYAEDVLRAGAAEGKHIEFLQKPPEGDTLFRRIREVLDATTTPAP